MLEGLYLGLIVGAWVLGGNLAIIEQLLQYFQPLVFLIFLEILTDFKDLMLHCSI